MLVGFARGFRSLPLSRAGYQAGLASLLLLAGAGSVHDATALGETRTLSFHHTHSEKTSPSPSRNGRYDEDALKDQYFFGDGAAYQTTMDRHLPTSSGSSYDVDGKQPIQIISAYRSPATNAMLRRCSRASHVSASNARPRRDFFIPAPAGADPFRRASPAAWRRRLLPHLGIAFVHLTGSIRHWPR